MRQRRETAEHPFGTLKMRMGATHFLMKRLPKVATEMALHVLAYNLTRAMNIMGAQPLMAAIRAWSNRKSSSHRRLAQFRPLVAKCFDTVKDPTETSGKRTFRGKAPDRDCQICDISIGRQTSEIYFDSKT
jgi:hypothetical protein